ncbi:MAG: DUF4421 family protein [Bacteroidales bacterium]|nr:DUF4421 family protein [Bacteroidales bacterium]
MEKRMLIALAAFFALCSLPAAGKVDTAYVAKLPACWKIKLSGNCSGVFFDAYNSTLVEPVNVDLESDLRTKVALGFGYGGLMLNIGFNPASFAKNQTDIELSLSCYRNTFGFDLNYRHSKTLHGTISAPPGFHADVQKGNATHQILQGGMYYAVNHKRFSYPAAFKQTFLQKKSAGSLLVGLSGTWQHIRVGEIEHVTREAMRFSTVDIALGCGYGYNFAITERLLFHLSVMPAMVFGVGRKCSFNYREQAFRYRFPEGAVTAKSALVWHVGRFSMGLSADYRYLYTGRREELCITSQIWNANAFVDVRFGKKGKLPPLRKKYISY